MPKYTPKASRERAEKFENSWQENAPTEEFADVKLADFKAERQAVLSKEDEITASEAHTKTLQIERDNLNETLMETCDYIAGAVKGNRNFGPDSALYGGFGYVRDSDRKRGGRKSATLIKT